MALWRTTPGARLPARYTPTSLQAGFTTSRTTNDRREDSSGSAPTRRVRRRLVGFGADSSGCSPRACVGLLALPDGRARSDDAGGASGANATAAAAAIADRPARAPCSPPVAAGAKLTRSRRSRAAALRGLGDHAQMRLGMSALWLARGARAQ